MFFDGHLLGHLTHWGRQFADDIFKCIFLNETYEFRLRFHWILFLRVELIIYQHWFRLWLGAGEATSHCLNQWWFCWRIYTSVGFNELNHFRMWQVSTHLSCRDTCQIWMWYLTANGTLVILNKANNWTKYIFLLYPTIYVKPMNLKHVQFKLAPCLTYFVPVTPHGDIDLSQPWFSPAGT